jgi:hypothetical protein
MNFQLSITYTNGEKKDLTCIASDMVAFESHFDLSIARLEKEIRLSHLFYLAWHAEKRTGATKDEFDKWLESVEMVSPVGDEKK